MSFTTYDELKTEVFKVIEDTSQAALDYFPTAVKLTELQLTKFIDTLGLKQNKEVSTSIGNRVIAKPTGFKYTHDVFLYDASTGVETRLKLATDDYIRDYWPNASLTGKPKYYAPDYENDNMLIAPTPDKVYTVRIACGVDVEPLSTTNQENYFSKYCWELMYYGTAAEMFTFNRNTEQATVFKKALEDGILAINNQGRRERRDDGYAPKNTTGQNTLKGEV